MKTYHQSIDYFARLNERQVRHAELSGSNWPSSEATDPIFILSVVYDKKKADVELALRIKRRLVRNEERAKVK